MGGKRFPSINFTLHSVFLHSRNFCGYLGVFIITKSKLGSEKKSGRKVNESRFLYVFANYNKMCATFNWNINTCLVFFCIMRCLCRDKAILCRKKMPFNYIIKISFFSKNYIINCPPCLNSRPSNHPEACQSPCQERGYKPQWISKICLPTQHRGRQSNL